MPPYGLNFDQNRFSSLISHFSVISVITHAEAYQRAGLLVSGK